VSDTPLTARIAGTGSFLPPNRQDNRELFAIDGIRSNFDVERARASLHDEEGNETLSPAEGFDRWCGQVTCIQERRIIPFGDEMTTEDMCVRAARSALEVAGMEAGDLDLVLMASVTPADAVPNMACTIGARLGIPKVGGYTLNAACAGFVYAMISGYAHIRSGVARNVLVISGDALSRITNYDDPKTAVLFADGAGAAVLTAATAGDDGFLGTPYVAANFKYEHLNLRGQGWEFEHEPIPKLHMGGGPRVLKAAIVSMFNAAEGALRGTGLEWDDVDYVVPHQANLRITVGLEKHLKLTRGRVVHTIEHYGNSSASTVGITLDEVLRGRHGPLRDPTNLVLTAVGGGYTTAAATIAYKPR
jgi:3-oxoacyl-[acyl-carrier-protein] synthase-3